MNPAITRREPTCRDLCPVDFSRLNCESSSCLEPVLDGGVLDSDCLREETSWNDVGKTIEYYVAVVRRLLDRKYGRS